MYREPKTIAKNLDANVDGIRLMDGQASVKEKVEGNVDHPLVSVTGPEETTQDNHDKRDVGPTKAFVVEQEFEEVAADGPSVQMKNDASTLKVKKGGEATVKGGAAAVTKKGNVPERSTSREGGKTPTTDQPNSGRAIVEVLDRVDTPQALATADGDVGVGVVVGGRNFVGEPTAFSVLPDAGREDDRPCECPDCCKRKPSRSTSSK